MIDIKNNRYVGKFFALLLLIYVTLPFGYIWKTTYMIVTNPQEETIMKVALFTLNITVTLSCALFTKLFFKLLWSSTSKTSELSFDVKT